MLKLKFTFLLVAFINFTDIACAVKAVEGMKTHPEYSSFKINFGKDRCGNPVRHGMRHRNYNQHHNNSHSHNDSNGHNESINPDIKSEVPVNTDE